jgi:hypothetical protein
LGNSLGRSKQRVREDVQSGGSGNVFKEFLQITTPAYGNLPPANTDVAVKTGAGCRQGSAAPDSFPRSEIQWKGIEQGFPLASCRCEAGGKTGAGKR